MTRWNIDAFCDEFICFAFNSICSQNQSRATLSAVSNSKNGSNKLHRHWDLFDQMVNEGLGELSLDHLVLEKVWEKDVQANA